MTSSGFAAVEMVRRLQAELLGAEAEASHFQHSGVVQVAVASLWVECLVRVKGPGVSGQVADFATIGLAIAVDSAGAVVAVLGQLTSAGLAIGIGAGEQSAKEEADRVSPI